MSLADSMRCTGCESCRNVCPFDAIEMVRDDEGFLQPFVDSLRCRHCKKCENACPVNLKIVSPKQVEKHPLCGLSLSSEILKESTSGGAFTELCLTLKDRRPVVFGAMFEEDMSVRHGYVDGVEKLAPLRKSKYVQSEIGYSYRLCENFLKNGRFVIFSGTPCQIAGLKGFLGKEYLSLFTIEFICHGVGSPLVFKHWLDGIEKNVGAKLSSYLFRDKSFVTADKNVYVSSYCFRNGVCRHRVMDIYSRLFVRKAIVRKSCVINCMFQTPERFADVTIGDSRGEKDIYPDAEGHGWSVIVANTKFGVKVVELLKDRMHLKDYPIEMLKKFNPHYFYPDNESHTGQIRDEFFRCFRKGFNVRRAAMRIGVLAPLHKRICNRAMILLRKFFKS